MNAATMAAEWLLPAEAYWSPAWFAIEQERLFGRCWNLVGTTDDLVAGRALTGIVAGRPVSVGVENGDLVARSRAEAVAVDTWAGYVFVHLDPSSAPPLLEWLVEFPELIGGFRPDRLVEVARHRFTLPANWKFFVENHVDVYHLWYLHEESLGAYDHRRAAWQTTGPHWVFYEPPRAGIDTHDERFWRGLRPIEGVTEDRWGSGAHLIFPNVTLATGAGFFMTYQCVPVAAGTSVVDIRVRAEPGSDASSMLGLSRVVIEQEDGAACAALQQAVASPWFRVGPLASEHELPITRFQRSVLEAMA
ncbi:MAG: aromatic ring-hydroxylating dioxygenase subunit alpha [Acidimicrobiales bacterium]